ncbi:hypothetical protein ACHQM5_017681 [Ranunculus cassubicifolius]
MEKCPPTAPAAEYPTPVAPPHAQDGAVQYPHLAMQYSHQPQYPQAIPCNYVQPFPGQNQGSNTPREWSTGICGCCQNPSNCCITFWCPCITFGQIAEVVDRGTTSCALGGAIYVLLMALIGCPCIYSCSYRKKLRNIYSLKEGPCGDCCVHFWCESCAVCQEYRELKIRGVEPSLGWLGNLEKWNRDGVTTQPVVPPGMYR